MIAIIRSQPAPAALQRGRTRHTAADCAAFDAGNTAFVWHKATYAHSSVRARLLGDQHGKCAYCETKLVRQRGRVDHYRPKDGVKQSRADRLQKPGYYWLAYAWENLLLTCETCNDQGNKGNQFPLRHPSRRAQSHRHDLTQEQPLLIDPTRVDPSRFISFRQEVAYAKNGNQEGGTTIDALRLNDDPVLIDARRVHLGRLERLRKLIEVRPKMARKLAALDPRDTEYNTCQQLLAAVTEAQQELDGAVHDNAVYAGMARAFLGKN